MSKHTVTVYPNDRAENAPRGLGALAIVLVVYLAGALLHVLAFAADAG